MVLFINTTMDPIADIINNFKHNEVYDKYKQLLDDLDDFHYDKEWVNAMSACGDTHKYTVEYTIGDFQFEYHHVLPEGEIASAGFSVTHDEDKEVLFKYSLLGMMMSKLKKKDSTKYPFNNALLDKFKSKYVLDQDDAYFLFFGILNAFVFGHSINIRACEGGETKLFYQPLGTMIDVVDTNT